jgi:hypothetical protein
MGAKLFGARVKRLEDPALLTGRGRFVDDVKLPGVLHACFVRSPHAHFERGSRRRERMANSSASELPTMSRGRGSVRLRAFKPTIPFGELARLAQGTRASRYRPDKLQGSSTPPTTLRRKQPIAPAHMWPRSRSIT